MSISGPTGRYLAYLPNITKTGSKIESARAIEYADETSEPKNPQKTNGNIINIFV